MSNARDALAAGALVFALAAGAAGCSVPGDGGTGAAEPYRTVVPAPSPAVSVPADTRAGGGLPDNYVPVPAPEPATRSAVPEPVPEPDEKADSESADAADPFDAGTSATGTGAGPGTETAPVPGPDQRALAAGTSWDAAEQERVAAALAAADAYTGAHPDTAEAAVYASVRADLACRTAQDGTALVTRALRSAGYTFTGCGPEEILSWFAGHPGYGAVLPDASAARPGSLVVACAPSGERVLGVYLGDGLAVFGSDAAAAAGIVSGPARTPADHPVVAPADLWGTRLLPAGARAGQAPVYVRPAPFV